MSFVDITKGWPNMYAVDLAIPVADPDDHEGVTIVEGMVMHVVDGEWVAGCPAGSLPYITGPQQYPTALDVARTTTSTPSGLGYPLGVGEMGPANMGGISLTNAIEFVTDMYTGDLTGLPVFSDPATGRLAAYTGAADEQVVGWCRDTMTDEYGRSLARVVAAVCLKAPVEASS